MAGVLGVGVATIAQAASLVTERGWLPVIALAGARDSARAVSTLRELTHLWDIALHHTQLDAKTHEFLERATDSLSDFNLRRMHELLPEKDGRFRQLSVSAAFSGQQYLIGGRSSAQFEVGPRGTRQRIGDASLVLRTAPVTARDGDTNYLLQGRVGIVVGAIDWAMVIDAAQEALRLVGSAGEQPGALPALAASQRVLAHNPALGLEDIEPVATLWEAFPRLGNLLSTLGGVDDLVTSELTATPDVKHVRVVLHLDPKRMKAHYGELAGYLSGLDKLFEADVRWLDAQNRTIALLHLDSKHLSARLELFAKDGLLLPARGVTVVGDQPITAGVGVFPYSVRASANFRVLGVGAQMRGARVDFEHERTERGMELRGSMKQAPAVSVSGAALGFVPTGLIDAFIPGDIQSLMEKSLATACQGNGGKGVELGVRFDRRPGGSATLDGGLVLEAIDNFLVKLGVDYFSDHMLPDDDVREDVARLMDDLQRAFSADLERYARAHKPATGE